MEVVAELLSAKSDVNFADPNFFQYTPLCCSASRGFLQITEVLIQNSADVNAQTTVGHPADFFEIFQEGRISVFILFCLAVRGLPHLFGRFFWK